MKNDLKNILLSQGLGLVKFGMKRSQIVALLGLPDEKELNANSDSEEDYTETWHYDKDEVSLGFDEEEDWRLVSIAVTSDFYTLEGLALVGKGLEEVEKDLEKLEINDLVLEDDPSGDDADSRLLMSEDYELNLWFEEGVLNEIQWGPLYNDEDMIEWPL